MKLIALLTTLLGNSDETVYICKSKTAEGYHFSKEFKGLKQWTHEVKKVGLKDEKAMGRRILWV